MHLDRAFHDHAFFAQTPNFAQTPRSRNEPITPMQPIYLHEVPPGHTISIFFMDGHEGGVEDPIAALFASVCLMKLNNTFQNLMNIFDRQG